jgi:hypothetical protein
MIGPADLLYPSMAGTESLSTGQNSRSVAFTTNPLTSFRVKKRTAIPTSPHLGFHKIYFPLILLPILHCKN